MNRSEFKKKVAMENGLGKRIAFLREITKVTPVQIEKAVGIPERNIRAIEDGGRTTIYEDLYTLVAFFNKKLDGKPIRYNGTITEKVTITWLLLGSDPELKMHKLEVEAVKEDFARREMELVERNFALDMQLIAKEREEKRLDETHE